MSHKTVDETTQLISANYNVESLIKVSQPYKKGRGKKSMKVLTTVSYIWCFNQTYNILLINTLNNVMRALYQYILRHHPLIVYSAIPLYMYYVFFWIKEFNYYCMLFSLLLPIFTRWFLCINNLWKVKAETVYFKIRSRSFHLRSWARLILLRLEL